MTYNTTKNVKTILFAGLILTLIASLTTMGLVNAQVGDGDQTRVAMKKQKIADNFQQFIQIREKTDGLEREIHKIEESINKSSLTKDQVDSLIKQKTALNEQIDAAYQELDRLEKISNELHKIPLAKEKLLEDAVQKIVQKYQIYTDENPNGLLEDVFIDAQDEIIYVLKSDEESVKQNPVMQRAIANMEAEINSLVANDNIKVVVSRIIEHSSCNLHSERTSFCQPAAGGVKIQGGNNINTTVETTTLSFKATRNGVAGFVMAGHGTLTQSGGEDIFQPTKSTSNKIGDLVIGMDNASCDCSFIALSPGRTVDNEVVSNDAFNWPISGFLGASGQNVGNFVFMSGISSNVQVGQIVSKPSTTNRIYADYTAIEGDSGAPVGKVLSGQITIYGIHEGTVETNPNLEKYVPYDAIKSSLGLT